MTNKIEPKLKAVPETMLITLWAKGIESTHPKPILVDRKASQIMEQIDYDFSKYKGATMSQVGCCIRAKLIDDEVLKFISLHPDAVVIQLGSGIDARYERLGSPQITHWYDLDLPDGIELRRKVLSESSTNTYLSQSLFDYSWIELVKSHGKPILIITEGVLMYFERSEIKEFFTELCNRLDNATFLFDMLAYGIVGKKKHHDTLRKSDKETDFRWSELNSKSMESWHPKLHVACEYYMSKYDQGRYLPIMRLLYHLPYFYKRFNQRVLLLEIHP